MVERLRNPHRDSLGLAFDLRIDWRRSDRSVEHLIAMHVVGDRIEPSFASWISRQEHGDLEIEIDELLEHRGAGAHVPPCGPELGSVLDDGLTFAVVSRVRALEDAGETDEFCLMAELIERVDGNAEGLGDADGVEKAPLSVPVLNRA
jgi:hypothetical protein